MKTVQHRLALNTINKNYANTYIELVISKPTATLSMSMEEIDKNARQQEAMCTQYTKENEMAIQFSRRREHEHYTSSAFVRLFVLNYKGQDKADNKLRLLE